MTDDAAFARGLARRGWRVAFHDAGGLLAVDMHESGGDLARVGALDRAAPTSRRRPGGWRTGRGVADARRCRGCASVAARARGSTSRCSPCGWLMLGPLAPGYTARRRRSGSRRSRTPRRRCGSRVGAASGAALAGAESTAQHEQDADERHQHARGRRRARPGRSRAGRAGTRTRRRGRPRRSRGRTVTATQRRRTRARRRGASAIAAADEAHHGLAAPSGVAAAGRRARPSRPPRPPRRASSPEQEVRGGRDRDQRLQAVADERRPRAAGAEVLERVPGARVAVAGAVQIDAVAARDERETGMQPHT